LYLRGLGILPREGGGRNMGKRMGGKLKGEGDGRWREGFGPPNNFDVAPLCCLLTENRPSRPGA